MGDAIRVMVVDDHPMWRDAVARDLADAGFDVVATAGDAREAVQRWRAVQPGVVVLDLNLPDQPGVEVCRQLMAADPAPRVLVLSASGEHGDVLEAVKSGATGYLVKSASREELIDAVRRTAAGDAVFTPGLAGLVLGEFRRLAAEPAPAGQDRSNAPKLTDRETEVLRLAAGGADAEEIASTLFLSVGTVRNYLTAVVAKLGARNRLDAIRIAREDGWL
jgi:DNA-binding NarL/FixJ family response regulator